MESTKLVEVFAGSHFEAEMVKSILHDSGIQATLKDANMGTIAPWYVSAGSFAAVKVLVLDSDSDNARVLIEEYVNNLKNNAE